MHGVICLFPNRCGIPDYHQRPGLTAEGSLPSAIRTLTILSPRTILSTTFIPVSFTFPKTVYPPSKCGCGRWVTNHCEPPVSFPDSAIPTAPRSYGTMFTSHLIDQPGPPFPSPRG